MLVKNFLMTFLLVMSFVFVQNFAAAGTSPDWISKLPAAKNSEQMIVVAGLGEKTTAWISMHEKDSDGDWNQIMTTPGFIGKNGLGKVREGDNKTPVGTFKIDAALGIAPDPDCLIPYKQIDENYYWSGDGNYKYNQLVDIREAPKNFNREDSEHLTDYNPHYTYILNMGYNSECTPGKGSALFMHCFGSVKPWTGGCVSVPREKMLVVMRTVKPGCVIVIDTLENLGGTF